MNTSLSKALSALALYCQKSGSLSTVTFHRGIEREGLRVNKDNGRISHTSHPKALGSPLTHQSVTTDYSEALLEFITSVHPNVEDVLQELEDIHLYVNHILADKNECLWPASMPGYLEGDEDVPIADYGSSNLGQLKHVYRKGLSYRYGRIMQCIAGMHYNFSFDEQFWQFLRSHYSPSEKTDSFDLQAFKSEHYFTLIRNFRRTSWLLSLLFGASPAVDASFLTNQNGDDALTPLSQDTLLGEKATSLRMSDLGYSNDAQSSLYVCSNDLASYIKTLRNALVTPYPDYHNIGVKVDGEYRQLNSNVLQIENEFYSDIRPKRVTRSGEHPSAALRDRGVEYIEVRIMDLDPFSKVGMTAETLYFLDVYLLYCMLAGDTTLSPSECTQLSKLQQEVVKNGRNLDDKFPFLEGQDTLRKQAKALLSDILEVAQTLTSLTQNNKYVEATIAQIEKLEQEAELPSKQLSSFIQQHNSYASAMLDLANQQQVEWLQQPIDTKLHKTFVEQADTSIQQQRDIEEKDTIRFDTFLSDYLQPQ